MEDIKEKGDSVLASSSGKMVLLDSESNMLSSHQLKSNNKSNFIYTVDNGSVYASELTANPSDGQIIYALDSGNSVIYMLSVFGDKIEEITHSSIKDSNVDKMLAYNGTVYYSVYAEKRTANKFTYSKPESTKENGIIEYNAKIPEPMPSKLSTYITSVNFTKDYLKAMEYDKLSSYSKNNIKVGQDLKSGTYKIPCKVTDWTVDDNDIYFYYDGRMGHYDMSKNQIGLYYGPVKTFSSDVRDGLKGSVFSVGNFGEDSTKSILMEVSQGNMNVKNIIELVDNPDTLLMSVDKSGYVYVVTKVDGDKYYSKVHVFDITTLKEIAIVPLSYVPTKLVSHNGKYYISNDKEETYYVGSAHGGDPIQLKKVVDGVNYEYILPVNNLRIDKYLYNSDGKYVDENGIEMLADGTLVNAEKQRINKYMQKLDDYGRAVNDEGDLIDKYNNIIDENGQILKYVMAPDGFFYNSQGKYVNEKGTLLVLNEENVWIDPDAQPVEPIRGHYDEKGEFIIDKDYLDKYPDAYERWEASQTNK